MSASARDEPEIERIGELLAARADAERRFLKHERKAERRLAAARAALAEDRGRLAKAQERVAARLRAVASAEAALQECQARRAAGPDPVEA